MPSPIRIIDTGDGSHSLRQDDLNENYHSWHGALTESRYVYIEQGLSAYRNNPHEICIGEIGHGSGLNAALAIGYALDNNMALRYVGLDPFPIPNELLKQLNYPERMHDNEARAFSFLCDAEWDKELQMEPGIQIKKIKESIQKFDISSYAESMDLIFLDAFGPEKQPEMWTPDVLKKCADLLKQGGKIVTYCAKGQFKRDLKSLGFQVETLPGPPGKREMVRAVKL